MKEPAYDLYATKNRNINYGFGAIGVLDKSLTSNDFLKHVCERLKTDTLRYSQTRNKKIKKVAVCGGSGSDLLAPAVKHGADAFITADVKYHAFQDAEDKILYIDDFFIFSKYS